MKTEQDWTNFDRLVTHLRTLPPTAFNYLHSMPDVTGAGCVACHVAQLQQAKPHTALMGANLGAFLGITDSEAFKLWAPSLRNAAGQDGIDDALERLAALEASYQRPVAHFMPDEAAFLASVRAVITLPMLEETRS